MRRRELFTFIGGAAAASAILWPLAARAQQSDRMRRIGVLISLAESDAEGQARVAAFRRGLSELGWTEGRNIRIDFRWTGGDPDRLRAHAAELVGLKPDAIFAGSASPVAALQRATRAIPIVFTQVPDPVAAGFVASLARPGGNTTGFATHEYTVGVKWLELLKEIAPRVTRVAVIYDPTNPTWADYVREIESKTPLFGVQLSAAAVRDAAAIERALESFASAPNGGLIVLSSPIIAVQRELIIALAAHHRLPAVYPFRYFAASGGLASYGVDNIDLYRRAASYVDRILKGAKPYDLPVQLAIKFQLVINLETAKALGLEVPPMLLARVDEAIE
jgi:putative ABC transport system substrate-binding protein